MLGACSQEEVPAVTEPAVPVEPEPEPMPVTAHVVKEPVEMMQYCTGGPYNTVYTYYIYKDQIYQRTDLATGGWAIQILDTVEICGLEHSSDMWDCERVTEDQYTRYHDAMMKLIDLENFNIECETVEYDASKFEKTEIEK